ncbi:metallophosphoesterase family protein [Marinitoga litoralis]|jgi:Icc-related predicted phosphoesterase|uniref:metallophosphoesterase family protein n=1 Tax=Marinitoga litoralis TaxID=570855 RepID=UPI001961DFA7|nr:metallophosphoesterase [Marinitoga litoralis]MBM7559313.1 Icc-related predicted phosphoesterase [Marinitoga litoralis]
MIDIVAVSDEERSYLNIKKCDILLGCGDLSPGYLDFLMNKLKPKISLMIYGNHDKKYFQNLFKVELSDYSNTYKGLKIIHQDIINLKEILNIKKSLYISGFSGAYSYGKKPFHFSEKDAKIFKRILGRKKAFKLIKDIDIIITHSPPGLENLFEKNISAFHKGSSIMANIYMKYFPKIWFYGHIHPRYTDQILNFRIHYKNKISYLLNSVPYKYVRYDEEKKEVVEIIGEEKTVKFKDIFL